MPRVHPSTGWRLAAVLAVLSAAYAQQPAAPARPDPFGIDQRPPQPRLWLDPAWSRMPRQAEFEGFPVFPSRLSGYGAYPVPGQGDPGAIPLLPVAPPETPGWPGWLRLRQRDALPFADDLALLVQHADRVWWRREPDDAFVPLYFHDKLRTLPVGAEIEVRQAGEFELLLHTSSRVVALGPTELRLAALTEATVEIDVRRFTRLRVQTSKRDHLFRLPNGSELRIGAVPAEGEPSGEVLVLLYRAEEPSRFGGRATLFNAGSRSVRWQDAYGTHVLPPSHRLTMFLAPVPAPIPAGLVEHGSQGAAAGVALDFPGSDGAALSWCGARFEVGPGRTLRLDPLQGAPFAAARPQETP